MPNMSWLKTFQHDWHKLFICLEKIAATNKQIDEQTERQTEKQTNIDPLYAMVAQLRGSDWLKKQKSEQN